MSTMKIFRFGTEGLVREYPYSSELHDMVRDELTVRNREVPPAEHEKCVVAESFPPAGMRLVGNSLEELSLAEKAELGLITVPPRKKIVGNQFVDMSSIELLRADLLTVAQLKKETISGIVAKCAAALDRLRTRYSDAQREGWPILKAQAEHWLGRDSNMQPEAVTALKARLNALRSEAFHRFNSEADETITLRAEQILANAAVYETYYGTCTGIQGNAIAAVMAVPEDDRVAAHGAIESIMQSLSFPAAP